MDKTEGPAEAYHEVSAALGEAYFLKPTPQVGALVTIVGRDGVPTRWHLSHAEARGLTLFAWHHPWLAKVAQIGYDQRASMT